MCSVFAGTRGTSRGDRTRNQACTLLLLLQPPVPAPDRPARLDAPAIPGSHEGIEVVAGQHHAGLLPAHIEHDPVGPAPGASVLGWRDDDAGVVVEDRFALAARRLAPALPQLLLAFDDFPGALCEYRVIGPRGEIELLVGEIEPLVVAGVEPFDFSDIGTGQRRRIAPGLSVAPTDACQNAESRYRHQHTSFPHGNSCSLEWM